MISSHPTVTIICPTPRAFQFPIYANDPYASPSSSPFEPDLKALSFTPPPPRPLSPTSSINSDSSSLPSPISTIHLSPQDTRQSQPQALPKRRKSLGGDPVERRPRKGDEDYIKRPENAFILFRRKCCEERNVTDGPEDGQCGSVAPVKKQRQADLSKMISQQWKSLTPEEKQRWESLAKEKKKEHEQMYPNYVYRPQRSKASKGKKSKGRKALTEGEQETDPETYSCLLPVSLPSASSSSSSNRHGRARSAPTPPLTYQTIHIPTVYMPSCPPSPTLRSQRTPLPKHPLDRNAPARMTYIPDDTLMPQPFSQSPYDPHLEVCPLLTSCLIPIAHLFLAEQRDVPGHVRSTRTERPNQQGKLVVIPLDLSDRFDPLTERPCVSYLDVRHHVSYITRGWSLLSSRRLPSLPVPRRQSRLCSPSRRQLLQPVVHGVPYIWVGQR